MAKEVIREVQKEAPRDKVVIEENPKSGSNIGVIIAIIVIVLLAILYFSGTFNGGGASAPAVNNGQ